MSTDAVLDSIDGALRDYETSPDAMRWSPDPEAVETPEPFRFDLAQIINMEVAAELGRQLDLAFSQMIRSFEQACAPLMRMGTALAHATMAQDRGHRIRCRTCNPAGNPPPFPGGTEYHRRMKARARRRRR